MRGGIHWLDPKTVVNPGGLVKAYADLFRRRGGAILRGDAASLEATGAGWQVKAQEGHVQAREAVVALGPQSGVIFRKLGYPIPLGIKRGHHLHFNMKDGVRLGHTVVDEEAGYVLAPMVQGVRLSTGIEFASPSAPANRIQLKRAEEIARRLVPQLGQPVEEKPWLGLRPCLPDMRPVIGEAPRHKGLWVQFRPCASRIDAGARKRAAFGGNDDGRRTLYRPHALFGGTFFLNLIGHIFQA